MVRQACPESPAVTAARVLLPDAAERVQSLIRTLNIGREARTALARYPEEASARHAQDTMIELVEEALYGDA